MEGGNCQSSAGRCKLSQRVCDQISHIDLISSDSTILVLGRWGAPGERQWGGASCGTCYTLGSSSGCLGEKKRSFIESLNGCVTVELHYYCITVSLAGHAHTW